MHKMDLPLITNNGIKANQNQILFHIDRIFEFLKSFLAFFDYQL